MSDPRPVPIERVLTDPTLFLNGLDLESGTAQFLEIPLDPRRITLQHYSEAAIKSFAWAELAERVRLDEPPARIAHYVFMTDYCGSTLLMHALGKLEQVFQRVERRTLVDLAKARYREVAAWKGDWNQLQAIVLHYQAKTLRPDQVVLFKEWGAANLIIREQLEADPRSRAVFMYSTLEEYLTASLKVPRRRSTARSRVEREFAGFDLLEPLRDVPRTDIPDHEACVLHWLALMYQYASFEYHRLARLRALRSSAFFESPLETLAAVAEHLELSVEPGELERIVDGPTFSYHSKQLDRPYSAADRAAALREARTTYRDEIDAGLRYAERLLAAHPLPERLAVDLLDA